MQYDYHSCPYEPDTGRSPLRGNGRVQNLRMVQFCRPHPKSRTMAAVTQATTAIISSIKFKLCTSSIKSACYRMTK